MPRAFLLILLLTMIQPACAEPPLPDTEKVVLVIHGGAGTPSRADLTPEREKLYRDTLERSLLAGHAILSQGGTSLDAVEASILVLEDSPLFNAGKGAVFTHDGRHELDASIMDGSTRNAGAVAAVSIVKNPITAARAVMDHSPHVLLAGPGADAFAREQKLDLVENSYFDTPQRRQSLEKALAEEAQQQDQTRLNPVYPTYLGTVGAVALDRKGHLAAATSTGGMTNKRFGRVGDSPIIGAGNYADNQVAVSCTGHGEFFIRYAVAHEIAARVRIGGQPISEAADGVINHTLKDVGGEGGAIALDSQGRCALPFNSEGMFRGTVTDDGKVHIAIFREE